MNIYEIPLSILCFFLFIVVIYLIRKNNKLDAALEVQSSTIKNLEAALNGYKETIQKTKSTRILTVSKEAEYFLSSNETYWKTQIKEQCKEIISEFFKEIEDSQILRLNVEVETTEELKNKVTYSLYLDSNAVSTPMELKLTEYEVVYESVKAALLE